MLGDLKTSIHTPLDFWTWMIQLESIEHDYIRIPSLSITSKFQACVERRVLNLELDVMKGPCSIPVWLLITGRACLI